MSFKFLEALYVCSVVSLLQSSHFFHTNLNMHRWDLKTAVMPVTPDLRLEVWGASPTWEAASAVNTEPSPKHTILFLLSFAKSCGVGWGLTASLTFVPAVKQSLENVFGGHDDADSLAHWKVKKVIISGLKFQRWGLYSVYSWRNKLNSFCKYRSLKN